MPFRLNVGQLPRIWRLESFLTVNSVFIGNIDQIVSNKDVWVWILFLQIVFLENYYFNPFGLVKSTKVNLIFISIYASYNVKDIILF